MPAHRCSELPAAGHTLLLTLHLTVIMGCGVSFHAEGGPPRSGWTGNRRAPSRTRAPTSPAGAAGTSTGGAAPAAGARGIFVTTTPSAAARHSQQAYEVLRIEAGMAATPMGHLADEFKFFCPLCMCAEDSPLCLPPWESAACVWLC